MLPVSGKVVLVLELVVPSLVELSLPDKLSDTFASATLALSEALLLLFADLLSKLLTLSFLEELSELLSFLSSSFDDFFNASVLSDK